MDASGTTSIAAGVRNLEQLAGESVKRGTTVTRKYASVTVGSCPAVAVTRKRNDPASAAVVVLTKTFADTDSDARMAAGGVLKKTERPAGVTSDMSTGLKQHFAVNFIEPSTRYDRSVKIGRASCREREK